MASQVRYRVSVIIPGRCEKYFQQTVDSALERATGDVEVIAVVDGPGQEPMVTSSDPRVKVIVLEESVGQRAAYNLGVRESSGEYVMKIDAHALMSPGYDEALKLYCPDKTTVLPEMRRLDVRKWQDKQRGKTHFMFFGLDLYCHYWSDYRKRPEAQVEFPEVLTGQGSCWFCRRDWNDYIGLLDEGVGSWGNVGIEVSLRTWLCGGRQIVNKNAWQAHWFRVGEGGFPYPMSGRQVAKAHRYTWENYYFRDDAFENQVRPFHWLIEKFAPVPTWESYLSDRYQSPRAILYYTDSQLDPSLAAAVRKNLKTVAGPIPIWSVSQEPLDFGTNICVGPLPRSAQSMYQQILTGARAIPRAASCTCASMMCSTTRRTLPRCHRTTGRSTLTRIVTTCTRIGIPTCLPVNTRRR
jgi:glycosyltransferase involved in cell wall biosynthesis